MSPPAHGGGSVFAAHAHDLSAAIRPARGRSYANVYDRVLRPPLRDVGIEVQTGTVTVRKRGQDVEVPMWDYQHSEARSAIAV